MTRTWVRGLLAALLSGAASAQTELPAALVRCRALTDAASRLACYDAVALPAAESPEQRFGWADAVRPVEALPQGLHSRIEGLFEGWEPHSRLRLANGQVWEVVDDSRAAYRMQAPAVQVRRGRFGGFQLEIEGVAQTPAVRRVR